MLDRGSSKSSVRVRGRVHLSAALLLALATIPGAQGSAPPAEEPERMPSVAYYFDWINSQYEGSTEAHALVNLEFFRWMHEKYGFELDVYLLDVGNIDDGPYTAGVGRLIPDHYGALESESYRAQCPDGFGPLPDAAAEFGCRLGIWLGPDGFGNTKEEERARSELLVTLCRDFGFRMFKFDAVAGELRPEKRDVLLETLARCREYAPDLLVLNERVDLLEDAPGVSTSLWEGIETYIDVFSWNETTAPHHRGGALARPYPPELRRTIEDHGVCLSSCLDRWDDDLVLQTFNRGTILAPEIYGSPWFLRDDELPRLARLCNLYRKYAPLLVDAIALPEDRYGPHAVARGNGQTRFLTLRNLTWEPVTYRVCVDESIGLVHDRSSFHARIYHPTERILGGRFWGGEFEIEVPPFRACLVGISSGPPDTWGVIDCEFRVVENVPGRPLRLELLGEPGTTKGVWMGPEGSSTEMSRFSIEGVRMETLSTDVEFPGKKLHEPWHRHLGTLGSIEVPVDAEALYEATCFTADNNALEVRSLERAGPTAIPQVAAARAAFLEQPMFINRGIWDRQLFDGDLGTFFRARREGGAFRLELGEVAAVDRLVLRTMDREAHGIHPTLNTFRDDCIAEYSVDLRTWHEIEVPTGIGTIVVLDFPAGTQLRYLRIDGAPQWLAEVYGYAANARLDTSAWRASNLFTPYRARPAVVAWGGSFALPEVAPGAYLAVAIEGQHGDEGAYAALRVDGALVGAPDRAVSFPSNTWEYKNVEMDHGYTYFFPLTTEMAGRKIEVFVLGFEGGGADLRPEVWLTAHERPLVPRELVLHGD